MTPWTAAYQAPPSVGFSREEYWSGLPLPSLRLSLVALIAAGGSGGRGGAVAVLCCDAQASH